eukprot:symbB.v1.2.024714.t1/scaffold2360.1/size81400/1
MDQRFEADEEVLYRQQRLKSLRRQSLISGLTLSIFWAYLELHVVAATTVEDLDVHSILQLVGAFLFAIAAFLSLTEINLEMLWLPLSCIYCALMAQLRCDPHLRLLSVAFATMVASFTLPLRASSLLLVHLTATLAFLLSHLEALRETSAGIVAMNTGLLLLLLCNFYYAFWRAEAHDRKSFLAGERVQSIGSGKMDQMASGMAPQYAVLSLEADLSIRYCGEQERLFFKSELTGQHLVDLDQHMITLLSRTDNPNRTILVTLDRGDGDHESFK